MSMTGEYFGAFAPRVPVKAGRFTTSRTLGGVALCLMMVAALFAGTASMTGCSQQTGTKVAQDIVNWTPSMASAVATVNATASLLLPADAPIFTAATAGFDAAETLVTQYAKAYLANPSASVLVNLQTAITTLEQNTNQALLQAAAIKDANSQKLALAAINGLATIANTILGLVQSISTKAQIAQMSSAVTVKLATVRPLMDEKRMEPVAAEYHVTVDQYFASEARIGF